MAVTVGAVYVDVLPTTRDFVKDMVAEILPEADKAGEEIGKRVGKELGETAGKEAAQGIEEGIEDSDPERPAKKKGKEAGAAFARQARAEIEAALRNMPDIELESDPQGVLRDIALIRKELEELRNKRIGVDISGEAFLADTRRLKAELESLRDQEIDLQVDFDLDEAARSLGKLEGEINKRAERSGGSFGDTLRRSIDSAIGQLPDIEIDADVSAAHAHLAEIREEILGFRDLADIDLDINAAAAINEARRLRDELRFLVEDASVPIDVRVNAAAALAQLEAVQKAVDAVQAEPAEVEVEVHEPNLGAFATKLKADIAKMAAGLPEIDLHANTNPVLEQVERMRRYLDTLAVDINVDTDVEQVLADLAAMRVAAEALDATDVDINVQADIAGLIAQLTTAETFARTLGGTIDEAIGDKAVPRISRFHLILGLIAATLPLIGAAVVGLPAAFAAIVGPITAIVLGTQGISDSFAKLTPQVDALKKATAEAFRDGLEPSIARLQRAIPVLSGYIVETADALSDVANQLLASSTSAESLVAIERNFNLINAAIRSAAPGLELFLSNLLKLTSVGLQGMQTFGQEMTQVGIAWQGVVDRLIASGAAQQAVQALFQILAELLNLAAGLTEFGAVLGAAFGPAVAAAISVLAEIFSTLAQALDSLPEPLQTVASIATTVGIAMAILGTRIIAAATAMRTGMMSALTSINTTMQTAYARVVGTTSSMTALGAAARVAGAGLGVAAGAARTLWVAIGGPIGIAITALTVGLSLLGQGQAAAAEQAEAHRLAEEKLATALQATNGVVDGHILRLAKQNLEAAGAGQAADTLGLSLGGMNRVVAQGGPAYDALIAKVRGLATENVNTGRVMTEGSRKALEQKRAAEVLLPALEGLRQTYADAAKEAAELGLQLQETGGTLVTGVGDAKMLEDAFKTLKDEMSSVKQIGDALYITMLQLSGQAIPLGLAQGQLGQSVRDVKKAFEEYAVATKESGDALLDSTGKINVASEAGFKLTQQLDTLLKSTVNSAAAAFDAAGGTQNLAAAQRAAGQEVAFARQKFIEMVGQFGITGKAAEDLADRYGLIPEVVVTQLTTKNLPQVTKDILSINQLVQNLPNEKIINIGTPSAETIQALRNIGLEVQQIPGTKEFQLVLQDEAARTKFQAFVDKVEHPGGQGPNGAPQTPVDANLTPAQRRVDGFQESVDTAPPANAPVDADVKPGETTVDGMRQDVNTTVAEMPINPIKGSGWDPDLAGIQQSVIGTVATMPINPIKGSGWDPDLLGIKDSVLLTVATMPINPIKGSGWDVELQAIKDSVNGAVGGEEGAAATATALLITVAKAPQFDADLQLIKDSVNGAVGGPEGEPGAAAATATALLITVAKSPQFDVDLQLIKDSINGAVAAPGAAPVPGATGLPALLITVAKAPTFDLDLQTIKNSINGGVAGAPGTVATPILVTVGKALTFDADLLALRNLIVSPPAPPTILTVIGDFTAVVMDMEAIYNFIVPVPLIWTVIGDFTLMVQDMETIYNFIVPVPLVWVVVGDFTLMVDGLIQIYNWVASNPLYWQVIPVFGGFGGGGGGGGGTGGGMAFVAQGAIFQMMAPGGVVNKALTPMRNDIAQVVAPNTWKVVGDRQHGDEAFIPLINKRRSHRILEYAAASMGRTILPMQSGGITTQSTGNVYAGGANADWASAIPEGGSSWKDRSAPLIGQVVAPDGASATDLADEVMFRLRVAEYGGLHNSVGR